MEIAGGLFALVLSWLFDVWERVKAHWLEITLFLAIWSVSFQLTRVESKLSEVASRLWNIEDKIRRD